MAPAVAAARTSILEEAKAASVDQTLGTGPRKPMVRQHFQVLAAEAGVEAMTESLRLVAVVEARLGS